MPRYLSAHVITCMTRQDLKRLVTSFQADQDGPVQLVSARADTLAGRMVCEWESDRKETVVQWLENRGIHFRGSEEWIMQVQLVSGDGGLVPAMIQGGAQQ